MFTKPRLLHRIGTRAAQPAANALGLGEGTLYYVTDEGMLERSDGTNWQAYSGAPIQIDKPQIVTSTGTVNALAVTSSYVILNNATDLTVNGIAAGRDGQIVTFYSRGAGHAYFNPSSGSASAADRLINDVTIGYTPIAAGVGKITYRYDADVANAGANPRWRMIHHDQGAFINIPFASCVYDSNTGAFWTVVAGDITVQQYLIVDCTMMVIISITSTTTTLAGVGARLRINFSAVSGWTWTQTTRSPARVVDGGAAQLGMATGAAGTVALIQFSHDYADTAWGVGAGRGMNGITLQLGLT